MIAALPVEYGLGRPLDGIRRAEPAARGRGRRGGRRIERGAKQIVFAHVRRRIALEDDRAAMRIVKFRRERLHLVEPRVALVIGEPHDLEGAVPFDRAARVVVNAFTGARQQARRGIAVVHDEVRVGFVALQRDANDHLPERGACERIRAAEALRSEQHVNAKRASLPHDAIEEQRGRLRDGVVLDEEFLELINEQQRARHRLRRAAALVAGDILAAEPAEDVAAPFQFLVHALKHAERKLAITFNRHDPRVRQAFRGVALELDALLEIYEIELDLIGAAREGEVRDDDVEERGFSRASLAREKPVLARAFADGEILEFRRARASDGDAQFVRRVVRPELRGRRGDLRKGNLHAVRVHAALADFVDEAEREFRLGRRIKDERGSRFGLLFTENKFIADPADADARLLQFLGGKTVRQWQPLIPMNQREHTATRAADGDALESLRRGLAEACGKIGHDEKVIFFRHAAGLFVVLGDRGVLVPQIHLDDFLDVLVQLAEPLVNLIALRPDAPVDEALLVVRDVHEPGEILPEPDRINDGEAELAGRCGREQAEDDVVQRPCHHRAAGFVAFKKKRTLGRIRERERNRNVRRSRQRELCERRNALDALRQIQFETGESRRGRELRGRRPRVGELFRPRWKTRRGRGIHFVDGRADRRNGLLPLARERAPSFLFTGRDRRHLRVMDFSELPLFLIHSAREFPHAFRAFRFESADFRFHVLLDLRGDARQLRLQLFAPVLFKIPLDRIRARPPLLNLRIRALELLLRPLPSTSPRRVRGRSARVVSGAGAQQRIRNRDGGRLRICETVAVEKDRATEQQRGDDSRGDERRRMQPAAEREHDADENDDDDECAERHVAERARNRRTLKRAQALIGGCEMRLEIREQRAWIFWLGNRVGAAREQFQKSAVAAECPLRPAFDLREHRALLGEPRDAIGEFRIRRRRSRRQRTLGASLAHLQAAEETSLRLLRAARERPQERRLHALRARKPPLVDGANARRFHRASRIHPGDLRGKFGIHPVQHIPVFSIRLVAPSLKLTRDLILLLREFGDRPPELREKFETPADSEIDGATHNRSRPF